MNGNSLGVALSSGGFGCAERSEGERSEPQRSTAPARAGTDSRMASRPDPEVVAKAKRRTYSAEYKQRILAEAEAAAATRGGLGALLRREGLYSSLLTYWRRERADGILEALTPRKRGPKSKRNPLEENQTKAMASLASFRDLFGDVCGKRDFDASRKWGVPLRQTPRAGLVLKLTALNEGRFGADLGAQQAFLLVPTRIPRQW